MRYLAIFLLLFSANLFAQNPPPLPSCSGLATAGCTNNEYLSGSLGECGAYCSGGVCAVGIVGMPSGNNFPPPVCAGTFNIVYACASNCSCPEGYRFNVIIDANGVRTGSCVLDEPTTPPDEDCSAGQVFYQDFCRDAVPSPDQCGSTYTTAVGVSGAYVCTNNGCGAGETQTVYTSPSGSWNVCNSGDGDGSGNASSGANTSGSNNSTGSNTSSPSSNGSGGDSSSGGSPGTGGGSGGGDGSGTNNSGGASSSVQGGGGGNLPTQSSSSVSSANGAASSGSGAGNCDPTAHNYLDCISRDNPGNGDGDGDAFEPSGGKGDFDGEAAAKRRAELEQQIADEIENIKQEISQELGGNVRGSGTITDKCVSVLGQQVCFGLAKFSGDLAVISQAIFMMVCVICVGIVLRN